MPAFAAQPAHPAASPTADSGTPLAALHHAPPEAKPTAAHPAPSSLTRHTRAAPPAAQATTAAKRAASSAAKQATHAATTHAVTQALKVSTSKPKTSLRSVTVSDLQTILIGRGAKLKRDGLYGPKTAQTWTALAKQKGLPGDISRVGPKIARVAAQTYDALAVPAIP